MPYGTVKVDNVTFTNNSVDATTTFSGIYASITNNLTLSGTASAATFTGTTANFTNVNAQNISVTTALSGLSITGGTAGFTTITGTTVTGTTANFASGVFTTQVSGATVVATTIELGNASDTTLSRSAAGVLAVEGVVIPTISSTNTLTNKTLTSPILTTPNLGTPSSGILTNCTFPTLNQNTTGNAATVTTNANLTGDVTSVGNATSIAAGVIVNADVNASAAIAGTKISPNFGAQAIVTTGTVSDTAGNVRVIPQNSQGSSYTLVATDLGKHISISTGGVTVPVSVFSAGDAITIYNNSSSDQTISQGSSTLRQAGTANTGNRTLAQYGVATILCVSSNTFVISGAGLT